MTRGTKSGLVQPTIVALAISIPVSFASFLFNILMARNLELNQFALFASAMTFLNLVGVAFSGFQLSAAAKVARSLPRDNPENPKFGLKLIQASAALGVIFAISAFFWNSIIGTSELMILALSLSIPVAALSSVVNGALSGSGRFSTQAFLSLLILSLNLVVQFLVIGIFPANANISILILVTVNLIVLLVVAQNQKSFSMIEGRVFTADNLVRVGSSGGFWLLANFDILFCAFFLEPDTRNQYSAAASFSRVLLFAFATVSAAIFIKLNRNLGAGLSSRSLLSRSLALVLASVFAMALSFFFFGSWLFELLYGTKYSWASELMPFMGFVSAPYLVAQVLMQVAHVKPNPKLFGSLVTLDVAVVVLCHILARSPRELALGYFISGLVVLVVISLTVLESKKREHR